MKRVIAAGAVAVALALGVSSGASAATSNAKKALKAFEAQLSGVQNQIAQVKLAQIGSDLTALHDKCVVLGQTVATAQGTKRPKLVKAAVWTHVVAGYAHYKAAADACLLRAPGSTKFEESVAELSAGNLEIRQVQAALGL
jgi:hypothetical protein